jgi:hypothetical protein
LMWIISLQKFQKMFDHLNNFCLHVILKDENSTSNASKTLITCPTSTSKVSVKLIHVLKKLNNC